MPWHAPESGQCWFILLASFHPLLSTVCEASLFCVNRVGAWKMKKWGVCRKRGTCNGQHKKPPLSQTFNKVHYTNECLACMKFSGAKAVMSHSLGNMIWAHYIWNRKMQPEVMRETVSIILTMPLLLFVPSSNSSFGKIERDWRLSLLID